MVFHHATPRPLPGILGKGPLGVHLFFAISGFLITTLLLRERRRTGTISLAAFQVRRALRIFPLYYFVLGLYVLHAVLVRAPSPLRDHFFHSLPYFATYTGNFMVDYEVPHAVVFGFSWSLATEEQFYWFFPPLMKWLRGRGSLLLAVLALFTLDRAAEQGLLSTILGHGAALRFVTSISAPICLGTTAAIVVDDPRGFRVLSSILGARWSAPLCLASVLAAIAVDAPLLCVHLTMTALVVAVCIREEHALRAVLDNRTVTLVGTVSYGVYLVHVAVISALKTALPAALQSMWALFGFAMPLSVVVALLTRRFIEEPFLRMKDRLSREPRVSRRHSSLQGVGEEGALPRRPRSRRRPRETPRGNWAYTRRRSAGRE